jgi:hypothetical protein
VVVYALDRSPLPAAAVMAQSQCSTGLVAGAQARLSLSPKHFANLSNCGSVSGSPEVSSCDAVRLRSGFAGINMPYPKEMQNADLSTFASRGS